MKLLIGHILLILSIGQVLGQKAKVVEIVEFNQSMCDEKSDASRIEPRIISLAHLSDTLMIEIGFAATCCLDYIPDIKYFADTLFIRYKAEGHECSCTCCYSFSHKIKGINSSKLTVKLYNRIIELSNEKYRTYQPTFSIIEGDTLNRTDKYGLKQGIWIDTTTSFTKYKIDKIDKWGHLNRDWRLNGDFSMRFEVYKDDKPVKWGKLYESLGIKEEHDNYTGLFREFYESGKLKRECHKSNGGELAECRQWESNGHEIK